MINVFVDNFASPVQRWEQSAPTYLSFFSRHLTKVGRIPDFIKSSMGGFLSLESSFLEQEGNKGQAVLNDKHPVCEGVKEGVSSLSLTWLPVQH